MLFMIANGKYEPQNILDFWMMGLLFLSLINFLF